MASKLTGNENKTCRTRSNPTIPGCALLLHAWARCRIVHAQRDRHIPPPHARPLALLYIAPGTRYDGDVAHNVKAATVFIDRMTPQEFDWTPYNIGAVWLMVPSVFIQLQVVDTFTIMPSK
ncbi:hypothetical protein P8452_62724 [Trifolium repens]|nr:hypothetical protein P8452_62724 [Trifolium repens]